MSHARLPLLLTGAAAVSLAVAGSALAGPSGDYSVKTFTEPATPGLPVTGPLKGYRVTSRARVIAPDDWSARKAPAGQLKFVDAHHSNCTYDLTYTVSSVVAATQPAAAYVRAQLPAASQAYVLDSGERGNRAFRVVRQKTGSDGRIRLNALWAGVLTKRDDIAPAGATAWTRIKVSATSHKGDECHAGSWREALGPSIGDTLAVARTALHFTAPKR